MVPPALLLISDERVASLAAKAAHESNLFNREDYADAAALLRELIEWRAGNWRAVP